MKSIPTMGNGLFSFIYLLYRYTATQHGLLQIRTGSEVNSSEEVLRMASTGGETEENLLVSFGHLERISNERVKRGRGRHDLTFEIAKANEVSRNYCF